MDYILSFVRPNLAILDDDKLKEIINSVDKDFQFENINRIDLVNKIFELWSVHSLNIQCNICYEFMTNGDNMTFYCGHKFHASCIIKYCIINAVDNYKNDLQNQDKSDINIDFKCPQCNLLIENISFEK
jgi:hypothetical protein